MLTFSSFILIPLLIENNKQQTPLSTDHVGVGRDVWLLPALSSYYLLWTRDYAAAAHIINYHSLSQNFAGPTCRVWRNSFVFVFYTTGKHYLSFRLVHIQYLEEVKRAVAFVSHVIYAIFRGT
jgi:hypothetical protein